ncbi:MAG: hypothetical protein ACFNP4_06840 [Capnocytophaga gingivalis]|jgi:hypothetical protein|uniref:hypothetical protein n=1 Tax=Capnocytophaga gingivalis TaxID=1017 RepID=UPI0036070964
MSIFNFLLGAAAVGTVALAASPELRKAGLKLVTDIIEFFVEVDHLDAEIAENQLNYNFAEIIRENQIQENFETINIGLTNIIFRDNNETYIAKVDDENQEIVFGEGVGYNTIDTDLDTLLDEYEYLTLE